MAETVLDLRKLKEDTAAPAVRQVEPVLVGPETSLRVRYTDPLGKVHEDVLVSRVLTFDGRAQVGRIQASLAGAEVFDRMPTDWQNWATAVAICTVQVHKAPQWFVDWVARDDALLYSVARKLWDHNALFFRTDIPAGAEAAPQRVVVDAPELSAADTAAGQ